MGWEKKGARMEAKEPGDPEAAFDPSHSAPGLTWKLEHDDGNYEK